METLGETLHAKRIENNLTLQQAARDTYVAQRYLEALEAEDFQSFPAPAYVKGFLRVYAEYLGLDPGAMIEMHTQAMIQERPTPVTDLWQNTPKQKKIPKKFIVLIILGVVVIALGTLLLVFRDILPSISSITTRKASSTETARGGTEVGGEIDSTPVVSIPDFENLGLIEQEFNIEQNLTLLIANATYTLAFRNEDGSIFVDYANRETPLSINQEQILDLDGDGQNDILLTMRSFNEENNSLVMRISKNIQLPDETDDVPVVYEVPNNVGMRTVLKQGIQATPFSLDIRMRAQSYLRIQYEDTRFEKIMNEGEAYQVDDLNTVKIATSNAPATSISVDEQDISIGNEDNTVLVLTLAWLRAGNRYQLVATELN